MTEPVVVKLHHGQDRLLLDKSHRDHLICAGIRYGKSFYGPAWHFKRVVENATRGSRTSLIVAPDYKLAEQIALDYYLGFLERIGMIEDRDFTLNRAKLILHFPRLKHRVLILSGEKPEKIIGFTSSHTWIDEAATCDPEVRRQVLKRNSCPDSVSLQTLYTTTPEGTNWLYELFGPDQVPRVEGTPFSESDSKLILHGSSYDNAFLTDDYLTGLEEEFGWDKAYFANYVLGEWTNMSRNRFYFALDERVNVGEYPADVNTPRLLLTLDNNPGVQAMAVLQPTPFGYAVVKDNDQKGQNVMHCCEQFVDLFPPAVWGRHRIEVYGDANLWHRSNVSYSCGYDILESLLRPHYPNLSVRAHRGNPGPAERSVVTNKMLNKGRLRFDRGCRATISSAKMAEGDGKGGIRKPSKDVYTHLMESIDHALVVLEPTLANRGYQGFNL